MHIRDHVDRVNPALILHPSGRGVGFADLERSANRLAHAFRRAGLQEGAVIAVLMENSVHVHTVMWAARRAGLYYTLINTRLTAAEAAYIIDDSGADALIGSRATRAVCEALAEHLSQGLPAARFLVDDIADATAEFGEELLVWLQARLARYKCPRSISFEAQLPRSDTGKLYKQELVQRHSPGT